MSKLKRKDRNILKSYYERPLCPLPRQSIITEARALAPTVRRLKAYDSVEYTDSHIADVVKIFTFLQDGLFGCYDTNPIFGSVYRELFEGNDIRNVIKLRERCDAALCLLINNYHSGLESITFWENIAYLSAARVTHSSRLCIPDSSFVDMIGLVQSHSSIITEPYALSCYAENEVDMAKEDLDYQFRSYSGETVESILNCSPSPKAYREKRPSVILLSGNMRHIADKLLSCPGSGSIDPDMFWFELVSPTTMLTQLTYFGVTADYSGSSDYSFLYTCHGDPSLQYSNKNFLQGCKNLCLQIMELWDENLSSVNWWVELGTDLTIYWDKSNVRSELLKKLQLVQTNPLILSSKENILRFITHEIHAFRSMMYALWGSEFKSKGRRN